VRAHGAESGRLSHHGPLLGEISFGVVEKVPLGTKDVLENFHMKVRREFVEYVVLHVRAFNSRSGGTVAMPQGGIVTGILASCHEKI